MKLNVTDADKSGYHGLDALGKHMLASESGDGEWQSAAGVSMITYYARVPNSPGWVLGISMESAEIDEMVGAMLQVLLFIFIGGLVIVGRRRRHLRSVHPDSPRRLTRPGPVSLFAIAKIADISKAAVAFSWLAKERRVKNLAGKGA
jgi:hypothetical protein